MLHFVAILNWLGLDPKLKFFLLTAVAGALIYAAGWIAARRFSKGWSDFCMGSVRAGLWRIGWSRRFFVLVAQALSGGRRTTSGVLLVSMILGVPWVLMSQLVAEIIFVGLVSDEVKADADREWLGRAAGWLAAGASLGRSDRVSRLCRRLWKMRVAGHHYLIKVAAAAGVISAIVTAVLGCSGKHAGNGRATIRAASRP